MKTRILLLPGSRAERVGLVPRLLACFLLCCFFFVVPTRAETPLFQTYQQRDGLASNFVTTIAFAPNGSVWIGTPKGATDVLDRYWATFTSVCGQSSCWINDISVTPDSKVWLATSGAGLTLFEGPTRTTYTISNSNIPSNYVTAIALDKQENVWIGTFGAGVARLRAGEWNDFGLSNDYINALALDASGHPWAATDDGAFHFDGTNWARVTKTSGLASSRVMAVAVGPDGRVWFGTDSGVTAYDGRRFKTYRTSDGLADDLVHWLAVDSKDRVWIGTEKGLSLFDGSTWKTYSEADGLADNQVTRVAVDSHDNVWVGTSNGLSALSTVAPPRPTTVPVVLVHGWHGPTPDQYEDSEFRYYENYFAQDGIQSFYAVGISPFKTLFQNAATVRDVIADVKARTGASRVDLIAFSMGGLNARAYLESTLYENDVRRAIILGTPEAGVRLWYPLLTREIEDRPTEPSAIELTPEYADLFNRTHAPRRTVPYDLLVGDARDQPGLELLKSFPPSDGLISEWSAHALTGPVVRHIVDGDVHAWNPEPVPLTITSYLYPQQTYDRYIRNALRDPDVRPIGFEAAPVAPVAPRNTTPMNVDVLQAGDAVTRTVIIDSNRAARFFAHWDQGDVDLRLRAPDGTAYTSTNSLDATYLKVASADFSGYSIPHAQTGTWLVIATRTDTGTQPMRLTTYADLDSDLSMSAATDRLTYPLGASVVVSATLSNRARNADVRARIEWLGDGVSPRGASTEVPLLQEGEAGNYAESLTGLTRGGYYLLRITARAAGFERERQVIFSMSPNTAKLTGQVQARALGMAGSYNSLEIDVGVDVARAGDFALAATLHDPQGQLVASLTAPITLSQGVQTATVSIPGRDLFAQGIDGPYTVDVTLMDASWAAVQLDERQDALITAPYRARDFAEQGSTR